MSNEEKLNVELYQKLKEEAENQFEIIKKKENIKLNEIEKIIEKYDIDPNINNYYLEKCLEYCTDHFDDNEDEKSMEIEEDNNEQKEISVQYFSKKYFYYINSLSLNQKREINNKIKKKKI